MNCPYCDESIALSAKFCPKCGLPLKEDATLMGASWAGGEGPNKWIIAGGAVGILAIALSIGWMTTHGADSTRRDTVVRGYTPVAGSVTPYQTSSYGTPPLSASPFRTAAPTSFSTGFRNTGFSWSAPSAPVNRRAYEYQEVEAPPVPLFRWQFHTPVAPGVRVAQSDIAPAPMLPPAPQWEAPAPPPPVVLAPEPDPRVWIWDPVQERYARRADAPQLKANRPAPSRGVASQELLKPDNVNLGILGPLVGTPAQPGGAGTAQ